MNCGVVGTLPRFKETACHKIGGRARGRRGTLAQVLARLQLQSSKNLSEPPAILTGEGEEVGEDEFIDHFQRDMRPALRTRVHLEGKEEGRRAGEGK